MNTKEFILALATYYKEPLMIDGKPNMRIVCTERWIESSRFNNLDKMLDMIVSRFIPTSTNQFPLIPHIIEVCEIETTDKAKAELARTVADRIIWAILNIGYREQGCRDKAQKHIGDLGWRVINQCYGKWLCICEIAERESVEIMRSHLRDSALAYINRSEKGLEDSVPALEDLKNRSQLAIEE